MISIDVSFPTSPAGVPDERSEADYSVLDDIENALDHRFVPRLNLDTNEDGPAPDGNLYANTYVKLSQGVTAYYVVDPPQFLDNDSLSGHSSDDMDTPVILCMHGVTNTSYMYRDIAEQLAVNTSSQVIAFDFYGRGRSPWTGVKCSMETFVCQATELLDCKFIFSALYQVYSTWCSLLCWLFVLHFVLFADGYRSKHQNSVVFNWL